jgi:hypothetical protein
MQRLKTPGQGANSLCTHTFIHGHFLPRRNQLVASAHRGIHFLDLRHLAAGDVRPAYGMICRISSICHIATYLRLMPVLRHGIVVEAAVQSPAATSSQVCSPADCRSRRRTVVGQRFQQQWRLSHAQMT